MTRRIYSALFGDASHFTELGESFTARVPDDLLPDQPGLLVLWGGEDISPSIYNHPVSKFTGAGDRPSKRDSMEMALAQRAMALGMPIVGICRGAQLMCGLSGGYLIQHVTHHTRTHMMVMLDPDDESENDIIPTTSLHHQMLYPWEVPHQLLAYAPGLSDTYVVRENSQAEFPAQARTSRGVVKEPEIVFFPETKCLAIQGHPEYVDRDTKYVQTCMELVWKTLL